MRQRCDVRFGSKKQTYAGQQAMSALPSKATSDALFRLSALGHKQTRTLFDHLVGALLEEMGHIDAERLRSLDIDNELKFRR